MAPAPDLDYARVVLEQVIVSRIGVRMHEPGIVRKNPAGSLFAPVFGEVKESVRRTAPSHIDPYPRLFRPTQPFLQHVNRRIVGKDHRPTQHIFFERLV